MNSAELRTVQFIRKLNEQVLIKATSFGGTLLGSTVNWYDGLLTVKFEIQIDGSSLGSPWKI